MTHAAPAILRTPAVVAARRPGLLAAAVGPAAEPALPTREEGYAAGLAEGRKHGYADGHAEGHAAGCAQGLAEGRAAAQPQIDAELHAAVARLERDAAARAAEHRSADDAARRAAAEALHARLEAFDAALQARLAAVEADAVAAAWTALCRVLGEHVPAATLVRALVAEALRAAGTARVLRVRVHPADHAAWSAAGADARADSGAVEWIADADIAPRGCEVDTTGGGIAARLDEQLVCLRDAWVRVCAPVTPDAGTAPGADAATPPEATAS